MKKLADFELTKNDFDDDSVNNFIEKSGVVKWADFCVKHYGNKSFMDYILDYLEKTQIKFVSEYIPYYISSIVSHILNLVNRDCFHTCIRTDCIRKELPSHTFYTHHGMIPDLRLNIALISPRGYLKDLFLNIFSNPDVGLIRGVVPIYKIDGQVTNKFFVGSKDDKGKIEYGLAWYMCSGIVGIPELDNLISSSKQTHSMTLMNSVLSIADSGHAFNGVGTGNAVDYYTRMTLWVGTQPDSANRFNVESGFKRRFMMLTFVPTKKEQLLLRRAYKDGFDIKPNTLVINNIRKGFDWLYKNLMIDKIHISNQIFDFLDKLDINHYDYDKAMSLILGYNIVTYWKGEEIFTPKLDLRLKNMLKKFSEDTKITEIDNGVEQNITFKTLSSKTYYRIEELKTEISLRTGVSVNKTRESIIKLRDNGAIAYFRVRIDGAKKPVYILFNDMHYTEEEVLVQLRKDYKKIDVKELVHTTKYMKRQKKKNKSVK